MKKFIKLALIFLMPLFVTAALLEMALRQIPNSYVYKKNYLDTHAEELETLILGSSHAYYNLDPIYWKEKAFNAANPAQSLQYDLKILDRYIEKMPSLNKVVIPIGYPTLFFDLGHTPESWRLTHYYRDFGFQISSDHFKFHYFILSKMLKWNLEDFNLHFIKKGNVLKISDLGWGTDYQNSPERDIEKTAKLSIFWHTTPNSEFFEPNKNYLEEITKICYKKEVELILLIPPIHKSYFERRNEEQVKKTKEFLQYLQIKYPNCILMDFSGDISFLESDFYDSDHLNKEGAKKLSLKLRD
ncbi:hypothetical protein MMU07_19245 [Aquiflexum sp. LQ15W]|uniref:hypothetical protein n=1 Tax=Cognataquiflexum nitidum TaxID=2922272 RepID=UPI001F13D153|nr:hypothetical protein [Cognataquiflexum nitidum]MCH6201725.1 hypothetical protein [Cognataquiflexum nitidum]